MAAPTTHSDPMLDEQIRELVDEIRTNTQRIARLEAHNETAREHLRRLLIQRGENWSDAEGYARLVDEVERASYDTPALDRLIITEPLRYGWLTDYRKLTVVRGGVRVK